MPTMVGIVPAVVVVDIASVPPIEVPVDVPVVVGLVLLTLLAPKEEDGELGLRLAP
jgi:hypothetical protein